MKIFCGFKSRNGLDLLIATNLRNLGFEVDVYHFFPSKSCELSLNIDFHHKYLFFGGKNKISILIKNICVPIFFFRLINIIISYDCYYFFAGYSLFSFPLKWKKLSFLRYLDLVLLNKVGKKIIYTFQGSELRYNDSVISCEKKRAIINSTKIFVTTPDLISFIPPEQKHKVELIRRPVMVGVEKTKLNDKKQKSLRVLHAPTNPELKGTSYIKAAIAEINENYNFDLELIVLTNVSKMQIFETARTCDFAIDQVILGWYGVFTLEMLSIGLPVMCYMSDSALNNTDMEIDSIPILNINRDTITKDILSACNNVFDTLWLKNFEDSRQNFLEKYYSLNALQSQLLSVMKEI